MTNTDSYERMTESYRRAIAGHVYIRETLAALFETLHARIQRLGRAPRILELGSHAGIVTQMLLERWPSARIVVQDESEKLVAMARQRLAGHEVEYHTRPLEALEAQVDFAVSVARHHHLPHDYLGSVRRRLVAGGMYILADELCPEYCDDEHAARIERADSLHIAGGYVLTSERDLQAYRRDGTVPGPALELERRRQRALWRWYRFVVDHAIEHGYVDVAVGELQSTHDDLITGSDAEHKFGPLIVERQFALAGFQLVSKRLIGPPDDPERQSMFVYEYALR